MAKLYPFDSSQDFWLFEPSDGRSIGRWATNLFLHSTWDLIAKLWTPFGPRWRTYRLLNSWQQNYLTSLGLGDFKLRIGRILVL